MPTEPELRSALREHRDGPVPSVDADAVIRRARHRRAGRQVVIGSASALAVAAIVAVGVNAGALFPHFASSASDTAALHSSAAPEPAKAGSGTPGGSGASTVDADGLTAARQLNQCGSAVVAVPTNALGLVLTVNLAETSSETGATITGIATLTNTGTAPVTGSTLMPTVIVSQNGTTRWHSHGVIVDAVRFVNLAPRQSIQFPVAAKLVSCDAADEGTRGFRNELPALAPGRYQVSAVLALVSGDGDGTLLVSGHASEITLG